MATGMIRAHRETIAKLRRLSEQTGASMPDLLRVSVDLLERDRLLDAANAAFAELRGDDEAWGDEQLERAAWDVTLRTT